MRPCSARAQCPVHGGQSLEINLKTRGSPGVMMRCFGGGCSNEDIVKALDGTLAHLNDDCAEYESLKGEMGRVTW
jgi:hypothetical protein